MTAESDDELIKRTLQGDPASFVVLMRRYDDRLFNTVFPLLGNTQDAQDVVQETFLDAYQSLHTFKAESQVFTWLYRIACNTAISMKRKRRLGGAPPADDLNL
jgi:RNA polymerase sigma-70 factor (ECF subfamily)